MSTTLRTVRDKAGHRGLFLLVALLLSAGTARAAGDYTARRFDVAARASADGLDVTESIVFEFTSGSFTYVFREIPTSRTDGVRVLDASMDGRPLPFGSGPGRVAISGGSRIKVEWHFDEIGPSTHRFDVHYIARGVAYHDGSADILRWRALPTQHRYRIDASRITFEPGNAVALPPETHNVGSVATRASGEATTIEAAGIQPNGWITAELRYPAGQLVPSQPAWRVHQMHVAALAPKWAMAAGALLILGLVVTIGMRQAYPAPEGAPNDPPTSEPPQNLPAALASVLAARGRLAGYQAIGTILDLADRGVLEVHEVRGVLRTRSYELSQVSGAHDLDAHEIEALTIAFGGEADEVSLSRARGRLTRHARRLNAIVTADLASRGFIDADRTAARDRLTITGVVLLLTAALGCVGVAPLISRYDGWPFLLPLAIGVAGLIGVLMAATMTPLSDAGLVEAGRWRGFKRHLKTLAASDRGDAVPSRWIVYAISLGLAHSWSRHLKKHPGMAPRWFIASADDSGVAFAAFIGSHAGGASGGGAGGGAAAGGGASGAG